MTERPWPGESVDYWPRPLREMVGQYGGYAVREAGIELFGFPPDVFELVKDEPERLKKFLEQKGA